MSNSQRLPSGSARLESSLLICKPASDMNERFVLQPRCSLRPDNDGIHCLFPLTALAT